MLWHLYQEHNFDKILSECDQDPIVPRRRRKPEDTFHTELSEFEEGIKYIDRNTRRTSAVIFSYTDIENRTFRTIRSLRVGDTIYDASYRRDPS